MNQYTYSCSGVEKLGNEVTKLRVDQLAWALWSLPVVVGKVHGYHIGRTLHSVAYLVKLGWSVLCSVGTVSVLVSLHQILAGILHA